MIDANADAAKILGDMDISVVYIRPDSFTRLPAVSYYALTEQGGFYCDNEEWIQDCTIQLDIWAKSHEECGALACRVNDKMEKNGYHRQMSMDVPSGRDGVCHKTMRFIKQFVL